MPSTPNPSDAKAQEPGVVLHPTTAVFTDPSERASRFNARKAAVFIADMNAVALSLLIANALHQVVNPEDPVGPGTYF